MTKTWEKLWNNRTQNNWLDTYNIFSTWPDPFSERLYIANIFLLLKFFVSEAYKTTFITIKYLFDIITQLHWASTTDNLFIAFNFFCAVFIYFLGFCFVFYFNQDSLPYWKFCMAAPAITTLFEKISDGHLTNREPRVKIEDGKQSQQIPCIKGLETKSCSVFLRQPINLQAAEEKRAVSATICWYLLNFQKL